MSQDLSREVYYEGEKVSLAKLQGAEELLYTSDILFHRPRWVADDEVRSCVNCEAKFSAMRRKHHCRCCGHVYCNQCCKDKVLLGHLGYTEPQRICSKCRPFAQLIFLAFNPSSKLTEKQEAAAGLLRMCQKPADCKRILELGGVAALVSLTKVQDSSVRVSVVEALHFLSQDPVLHLYLVENQAVLAVCRLLDDPHPQEPQMMIHSVSLLTILCKDPHLSQCVLQAGGLQVLFHLCQPSLKVEGGLCLLALQCLCLLLEHPSICESLLQNDDLNTLPRVLALIQSADEKVAEISLQILANMSTVSDRLRQRIIQEDMYNAGCLCKVLQSSPVNLQVLVNASCLVANLATTRFTQSNLEEHLACLCSMLSRHHHHTPLLMEVSRGIANLAQYPNHTNTLIPHLPVLCSLLVSSEVSLRQRGLLIIINLLQLCTEQTSQAVTRNCALGFMHSIAKNESVLNAVRTSLTADQPATSRPSRAASISL